MNLPRRGEIYYADLEPTRGSEQGGIRPVLIIGNNSGNRHSSIALVACISRTKNEDGYKATHYHIKKWQEAGLKEPSYVMLEHQRTIDQSRFLNYLGSLDKNEMIGVEWYILVSAAMSKCYRRIIRRRPNHGRKK